MATAHAARMLISGHLHLLVLLGCAPCSLSGIGYDMVMNSFWRWWNKGKLWKDIKNNYKEE